MSGSDPNDLRPTADLSKSRLTAMEMCGTKAWLDIHDRRPLIPAERITFGSAVDKAVETAGIALRSGQAVDIRTCLAAAVLHVERDDVPIDLNEVEKATETFLVAIAPRYEWAYASLQHQMKLEIPGLGLVEAQPDVILGSGIYDVKTANKSKPQDASLEMAFYALVREAEKGEPIAEIGYWTWVRTQRPGWQIVTAPVTDETRRWAFQRALSYVRARKADEVLNRRAEVPVNWTFPNGPKFAGLCATCQYSPANGGPCELAIRVPEEEPDAIAA